MVLPSLFISLFRSKLFERLTSGSDRFTLQTSQCFHGYTSMLNKFLFALVIVGLSQTAISQILNTEWQTISFTPHRPQEFLETLQNDPLAPKKIYEQFCSLCHDENPQIELGAPRKGLKEDWQGRLSSGLELIFQHTVEGINNMPPRGGCFECNDKLLKQTIEYMICENLNQ
ncbi:MAG: Cytochrome c5 [Francisellaceae bacterium]|nr:Cytochrome c5 [Francisellaceae bacterium]